MLGPILKELREHIPFTLLGAFAGIIIMAIIIWGGISATISHYIFHIFHPLHIMISAFITTAMYRLHKGKILPAVFIGYFGFIGICTLSDIIFPYLGGIFLGIEMEYHLCFIKHWWLVSPLAFLGIAMGIGKPTTKIPHSGHVLLSTLASLFYLTAFGGTNWLVLLPLVFPVLFLSVWVPCCLSDIAFLLLFIKKLPDSKTLKNLF